MAKPATVIAPKPGVVAGQGAALNKHAEALRSKKLAKRLRHRVALRRSHTSG